MSKGQRRFRIPRQADGQSTSAQDYVARAWPEATDEQVEALLASGNVRADGIVVTRPKTALASDSEVVVTLKEAGDETYGLPEVEALLWDDRWLVVDKPLGIPGRLSGDDPMDPVRFMADMLGVDRQAFFPVWQMPTAAGGPWLVGRSKDHVQTLVAGLRSGLIQSTWYAICERPSVAQGRWERDEMVVDFAIIRAEGGLAELQLTPQWPAVGGGDELVAQLLDLCAAVDFAVLGDAHRGGYLVDGGLRLRLGALYGTDDFAHSWPAPRDWWPDEPVTPAPIVVDDAADDPGHREGQRRRVGRLEVSRKTLEIVAGGQGHPWIYADKKAGDLNRFEPGDPVELNGPQGPTSIFAVIDGSGPVGARLWSTDREAAQYFDEEVAIRLDEAIGARRPRFKDMAETDIFRLIYGQADGLPGLWVDRVGPMWRVITVAHCARGYRDQICQLLQERDPEAMVVAVEHLRDLRRRNELPQARIVATGQSHLEFGQSLVVRERGLKYRVEPWEGVDVGFFADQRDNRDRAVARANKGEHWLNLFCHTGAFSVALAARGVETTNIDLSKRYLRWLDTNFELNGLSLDLRRNVAEDARTFLERDSRTYDGMIIDPPTAAASDRGFWSVRDDYEDHLVQCFSALRKGGSALVCRNDKKAKTPLEEVIEAAAKRAGRQIESIDDGPPSADFASPPNFPEGIKFVGRWLTLI